MTRVLSGAVLIAIAIGVVWFAPPIVFFVVAEILLLLAFTEYVSLARACDLAVPAVAAGTATVLASVGVSSTRWIGDTPSGTAIALDAVLMSIVVVLGALTMTSWRGDRAALAQSAAAVFPALYLGLPIGGMIAIRALQGREALFLLMLTVMVSDTAQYYSGRAFGRRPLAPAISPKKTVEGAIGGFVAAAAIMTIVGAWWLPGMPVALRAVLGATI